ncbi:MAG: hypothetical protein HY608_05335 [Planctomycetes bacterium]|nr:hypothetical protein [Planctomycetota bacterium]
MNPRARRGIVLVLVAMLLVLLLGGAVALVQLTRARRLVTAGSVDYVRARLHAASGVERAVSEVVHGSVSAYEGEDWDGSTTYGGPEETPPNEVYEPGILNVADCPVEHARRPSFWSGRDGNLAGADRAPDWTKVDGRNRGVSGRLRGTYADRRDARGAPTRSRSTPSAGSSSSGGS